ncbi:hypothetical protein WJX74_007794 [Apatococcus lobatus]|uniref:Uncharacterized protein n=1 Tax=Apatococcus lobatus TaxID=904363 RepID=A0AAW1RRH5_9CHLO
MQCPEVKSCPSCGGLFLRSGWKVRVQPGVYRASQQKGCRPSKGTNRSAALVRAQSDNGLTTTDSNGRPVQLVAAVEQGQLAVKPASPPVVLKWCSSGQQELQIVSNTLNATVIALAVIAVGERLLDESTFLWWQQWDIIQPVRHVTQALWHAYDGGIEKYPILAKAVISGLVYSLGDITAQSYEGRSVSEFDGARIARSGACGFLGHGPLSHFYYNALDRYFIVTPIFTDKWFTPIIKLFIDQTAWAVTWNSLYYCLLGALKGEGPDTILATIKQSWFPLVKAGWRIWPFAHAITYNYIPTEHKLLWVNMVELSWVSILSFYGQQQRERAIAAAMQDAALPPAQVACALPNAGSTGGGSVSEELLRSMETERNIIFEGSDGRISRPAAEVYVEAAIAEAAMKQLSAQQAANMPPIPTGQSSDGSSHYSNGAAGGNGSSSSSSSSNGSSPSSNGAHSSSGADTRERVK